MRVNPPPSNISPIQARNTPGIYNWMLIPLFIIVVCIFIYLVYRSIQRLHSTPEWIEAQKKRLTTRKDCTVAARRFSLAKDEELLLWDICRATKAANISYTINNTDALDSIFKKYYAMLISSHADERKITKLFLLRYKIEMAEASESVITSTTGLVQGTKIVYVAPDKTQIQCTLKKNTAKNMTLAVPRNFFNSDAKPEPLSKAQFVFTTHLGMTYMFVSRVIRYSTGLDNGTEMVLAQTNDLRMQSKRKTKRSNVNIPCTFSAVNENKKVQLHSGTLANISADGCCILTNLPIKENQNIAVSIMLAEKTYDVFGKIVSTHKTIASEAVSLAIVFTKISNEARNKIFAYVYNYMPHKQNDDA